jgi:hypothetical protein
LKSKVLICTLCAILIVILAFALDGRVSGSCEKTAGKVQGKPTVPIIVTIQVIGEQGAFRDVRVFINSKIDIAGANLLPIAFDGLEVVSKPANRPFDILAGLEYKADYRLKLNQYGGGTFTAEISADLSGGSAVAENGSISFASGVVTGNLKAGSRKASTVTVEQISHPKEKR